MKPNVGPRQTAIEWNAFPYDNNRKKAVIVDEQTDWVMPMNQVLLRYGKAALEQAGTKGGWWNTVTKGKGVECSWDDLKVGDVVRIGSAKTSGYSDYVSITEIVTVDELHNGTESVLPMFVAEDLFHLYADKPTLSNYPSHLQSNLNNLMQFTDGTSAFNDWSYDRFTQLHSRLNIQGTDTAGDLDGVLDLLKLQMQNGTMQRFGVQTTDDGPTHRWEVNKGQFWLNTREGMLAEAISKLIADASLTWAEALQSSSKSYVTAYNSDDANDKKSHVMYGAFHNLPGTGTLEVPTAPTETETFGMGWDASLGGTEAKMSNDSPAFRCYRISSLVNATSFSVPSPSCNFDVTDNNPKGDIDLHPDHPLYPKSHMYFPSSTLAPLSERHVAQQYNAPAHSHRSSATDTQVSLLSEYKGDLNFGEAEPIMRWQKYHFPLYKAGGFTADHSQLKISLGTMVKEIQQITLTGYSILNQAKPGFQSSNELVSRDFLVLRIKEMEGAVMSNNTLISGAFAVLPNHSQRNSDDGSAEMTATDSKGIATLLVPNGARRIRSLTFELQDRDGQPVELVGRVQLWFKLRVVHG